MRSDAETFQPLGPKVERKTETPPAPEWQPTGTPNIERHSDGRLRNVQPTPPPKIEYYTYYGTPATWGRA